MRFAILADIHANWPAFEAVLEDLDEQPPVHMVYCLGDIIGYYTFPRECLAAVLEREIESIRGNHERYLVGEVEGKIKQSTLDIIEFTRREITDEQYAYVEMLQNKRKVRGHFVLVHGSPRNKDEYMMTPEKYAANLAKMAEMHPNYNLCFFGHTHKAVVAADGVLVEKIHKDTAVRLEQGKTYLVNPGSVGQPRDGCPLASYCIYDAEERVVHFYRREYAIEEAQQGIARHGFSAKLAERLERGK